jgi:hypothetical protein
MAPNDVESINLVRENAVLTVYDAKLVQIFFKKAFISFIGG